MKSGEHGGGSGRLDVAGKSPPLSPDAPPAWHDEDSREGPMTVTWVRRLSDGEELVIEQDEAASHGPVETDPRASMIDRRSQALTGDSPSREGPADPPTRE
jgi:hypothetical protein